MVCFSLAFPYALLLMLGSYLLYHSKNEKTRQNYDRSQKSYQLSHCDNLLRDIKYALRAFTLFVFRVSMVSKRNWTACQHLLSQAQRIRKKVYINETEPVQSTGSNHLSIGCCFYLTYFKSRKTTYMIRFLIVSIDLGLLK